MGRSYIETFSLWLTEMHWSWEQVGSLTAFHHQLSMLCVLACHPSLLLHTYYVVLSLCCKSDHS